MKHLTNIESQELDFPVTYQESTKQIKRFMEKAALKMIKTKNVFSIESKSKCINVIEFINQ